MANATLFVYAGSKKLILVKISGVISFIEVIASCLETCSNMYDGTLCVGFVFWKLFGFAHLSGYVDKIFNTSICHSLGSPKIEISLLWDHPLACFAAVCTGTEETCHL